MPKTPEDDHDEMIKQKANDAVQGFLFKIIIKIIRDKYAFLLSELLKDIISMSEGHGLATPVVTSTRTLKRWIVDEFPDDISFFHKESI